MPNPFNTLNGTRALDDGSGEWRAEVDTGEGYWYGNGLTFAERGDAESYALDLRGRWTLVRQWRVVPVETPLREAVA